MTGGLICVPETSIYSVADNSLMRIKLEGYTVPLNYARKQINSAYDEGICFVALLLIWGNQ